MLPIQIQNLGPGITLTIIGMGLVFVVLTLLWGLIMLLLRIDAPLASQPAVASNKQVNDQSPAEDSVTLTSLNPDLAASELSPEMLAAIMVAVRMHRRIRRKQAAPAMRSHQPGTLPSRWVGAGRTSQNQSWHPRHR